MAEDLKRKATRQWSFETISTINSIGDKYSDCIIVSRGHSFPLHRVVIYSHSQKLAKMVHARVIEKGQCPPMLYLDDDVDELKVMIEFFYQGSHTTPSEKRTMPFHLGVFKLARKHDIKTLKYWALEAMVNAVVREDKFCRDFDDLAKVVDEIALEDAVEWKEIRGLAIEELRIHHRAGRWVGEPELIEVIKWRPDWFVDLFRAMVPKR